MGRRIHTSEVFGGEYTSQRSYVLLITHQTWIVYFIHERKCKAVLSQNGIYFIKNAQNRRRRLCFSALWWLCEPENNIYRASHLTSFITKSHTLASPMKLGVNPSSASLFSSSPSPCDPGLYLPSSHLHSRKGREKKNFGVIQQHW